MPRSPDLDTIAPDDSINPVTPILSPDNSQVKPISKPIKKPIIGNNDQFRKRIYGILGETSGPLSAFLIKPHIFNFQEKDEHEEIILALRPHWFTNLNWIVITIIMTLAPLSLRYVPLLNFFQPNYQFVAILFWYLITFIFAFERFLSWYFNVFIITDERVIDIDFHNLLDKKFSEAKINMIQDISYKQIGVSQTLLNYGTVLIQTASEVNQIVFEKVPNPDKIIKVLQELRQEEEQEAIDGRIN